MLSKTYAFENDIKYQNMLKEDSQKLLKECNEQEKMIMFDPNDFVELGSCGHGGYGLAVLSYHLRHHQLFIIKKALNSMCQRSDLEDEYWYLRQFVHPSIIHAYGCVDDGDPFGIVLEYGMYGSMWSLPQQRATNWCGYHFCAAKLFR